MAVLTYMDTLNGEFQKSTAELLTFGKQLADSKGTELIAIVVGKANDFSKITSFGANKIIHTGADLNSFDTQCYSNIIAEVAKNNSCDTVIFAHSSTGKSLAGYTSVLLDASCVSGINAIPTQDGDNLVVTKNVFSGKAEAEYHSTSSVNVLTLAGNSIKAAKTEGESPIETADVSNFTAKVKSIEIKTVSGTTPLPEADLVVSAGRGMKGPENWGIIEELANVIGATTACSRPVADIGWRPHHEHVGQTGVAIRPNLYIAIGISGAIQHLAGVNQSKTIVVINKDSEAPFFKAADYGVCGDLFDIVPRLTEAIKKSNNSL